MNDIMAVNSLPKVELHVHLESSFTPETARFLTKKNNVELPLDVWDQQGNYRAASFDEFLHSSYYIALLLKTSEDYEFVAYEYLKSVSEQGCIYVEMMVCPDLAFLSNISYPQLISALEKGIQRAEQEFCIKGRLIVLIIRHFGISTAEKLIDHVLTNPHPYVVGVTLAGDERKHQITDFGHIFRAAKSQNLGVTPHVGELCGEEEIRKALTLPIDRIGHGLRAGESLNLIRELAERKIHLEVCLSSNKSFGFIPDYTSHPARSFFDGGISLSFNTDDPPFFLTSLTLEYAHAHRYLGFSECELLHVVNMSIDACFADDDTKTLLRKKVSAFSRKHHGV